jgi:uncharacterized protein (DUF2141 family)
MGMWAATLAVAPGVTMMAADAAPSVPAPAGQPSCTAAAGHTVLSITVKNVRSSKGNVNITIYPGDPRRFLAPRAKVSRVRVPAAPVVHTCMSVPVAGDYAIAIYHDENGDRRFNRTLIGLPAEDYGFSNDAPTLAGLPSYSKVKFTALEGVTPLTITMRRY